MWHKVGSIGAALVVFGQAAAAQPNTLPAAPTLPSAAGFKADTAHPASLLTPRGVRFFFRERGVGALATAGSRVAVRYSGFLPNGRLFDATAASGGPLRFRVGRGEVIPGWDDLLPLLPVGSRVRAWIPAALAYGAKGVPDPDDDTQFLIPPDSELIFELHVISVR